MAKTILMDQLYISVYAPGGLKQTAYDAIYQALNEPRLHTALAQAVRDLCRRHQPCLRRITVTVSR
jgi:hypothetical protein